MINLMCILNIDLHYVMKMPRYPVMLLKKYLTACDVIVFLFILAHQILLNTYRRKLLLIGETLPVMKT